MYLKAGIILLSIIFLIGSVSAIPPLPYEFYGNITINGTPAASGTIIVAKLGEIEVGNITITEPGVYGGSGTFDKRLVVNGDEKKIGEYISFWAGGMQSSQKVKLWAGESQRLDLTFAPGSAGSIDASITPSQQTTVQDIPTSEPTKATPLTVVPLVAGLFALVLFSRRV
ncbi:MAG TPA: hypothetical protein VN372_05880 [Methanospirillum sp.]|nr:hypothetical protein [Methanospirillum sp.]